MTMIVKTILITGCSTGIGYDAAITLKNRGHRVIATSRKGIDVDRLQSLGLEAVELDVNDSASIVTAFSTILGMTSGRIDVLINNAGYGQAGAMEDISREVMRQQFETNVFGLLELTNLVIPVMRQQGQGRIINVSSILGIISLPMRGAYNASKYAVEAISDTLRLELAASGIEVITIEPGPIVSKFRDNCVDGSLKHIELSTSVFSKQYQAMLTTYKNAKKDSMFTLGTDAVIKKFIHAIESKKPKAKYPVTFPAYLFIFLKRTLTTRMLDRFLGVISRKELS